MPVTEQASMVYERASAWQGRGRGGALHTKHILDIQDRVLSCEEMRGCYCCHNAGLLNYWHKGSTPTAECRHFIFQESVTGNSRSVSVSLCAASTHETLQDVRELHWDVDTRKRGRHGTRRGMKLCECRLWVFMTRVGRSV